jgi:hypothetical protein
MTDDLELVKGFIQKSDFSEHIKTALLKAIILERLEKSETEFDRLIKELSVSVKDEN